MQCPTVHITTLIATLIDRDEIYDGDVYSALSILGKRLASCISASEHANVSLRIAGLHKGAAMHVKHVQMDSNSAILGQFGRSNKHVQMLSHHRTIRSRDISVNG